MFVEKKETPSCVFFEKQSRRFLLSFQSLTFFESKRDRASCLLPCFQRKQGSKSRKGTLLVFIDKVKQRSLCDIRWGFLFFLPYFFYKKTSASAFLFFYVFAENKHALYAPLRGIQREKHSTGKKCKSCR